MARFIIYISLLFFLLACQDQDEHAGRVSLKISTSGHTFDSIRVTDFSSLMPLQLARTVFDTAGKATIKVDLHEARFVSLQIGELPVELYISPGDDMELILDVNNQRSLRFFGSGSEINNYFYKQNILIENIKMASDQYISFLGPAAYKERLDSLTDAMARFHNQYLDSVGLEPNLRSLVERRNLAKLNSLSYEYAFLLKNNALGRGDFSYQLPSEIASLLEMPVDTALLGSGQLDYGHLLGMYIQSDVYMSIFLDDSTSSKMNEYPALALDIIRQLPFPATMIEYMEATNINYWLMVQGATESTRSSFLEFKQMYSHSPYLKALQLNFDRFDLLSPGKIAPDFFGLNSLDDTVYLSSIAKGQPIYIDVWASWCGPCLKEVPASIDLQRAYNSGITFLNVSVDEDKATWLHALKKINNWKGVHIRNDGSIYKSYLISSVPRHILVDQKMRIVTVNAPAPSSQDARKLLDSLLTIH